MPFKSKKKLKKYWQEYRKKNKEKLKKYNQEYYQKNK